MAENKSQLQGLHRMKFTGKSSEYFFIWLTNIFLITITLGVYSAWATVREHRYFYNHMELDGEKFDYHAQPLQILIGRLLVVAGIVILFFLLKMAPKQGLAVLLLLMALIPWGIIHNWRYNAVMSSYRGVRFNYTCRVLRTYWVLMLCPALLGAGVYTALAVLAGISSIFGYAIMLLTVVILIVPALALINGILCAMQYDLYVKNMYFGHSPFVVKLKKLSFIKIYLVSWSIIILFLISSLVLDRTFYISLYQTVVLGRVFDVLSLLQDHGGILLLNMFVLLFSFLIANSYYTVAQRNYLYNQMTLNTNIRFHSSVKMFPYMWLILSNSLMTVLTLGFAFPVAKVRFARYMADCTAVEGDLSTLDTATQQMTENSAEVEVVAMV